MPADGAGHAPANVSSRPPCTGVILAGGRASRYGGAAKGLERVGGARIIDRVAAALREAADTLLLISNDPRSPDWIAGVRCEGDVILDAGGLGGIHAALHHAGTAVILAAWDMPFVPAELLAELRSRAETERADAVVPESDSRRGLEPLCAYYGPGCLPAVEARLRAGDRRVIAFYEDVRLVRLPADEVARFGDPAILFMNVNTPEDRARAEMHA